MRAAFIALLIACVPAYAQVTRLSFRPLDAAYTSQLNRVIFISALPNQLHIYDPVSNSDQTVGLPAAPLNVSLAPDGQHAAVALADSVAYVDLVATRITNTYATAVGTGRVICGSGYIYVFPSYEGYVSSINIASGTIGTGGPFYVSGGVFDSAVNAVYSTQDGLSPNSLNRYDASGGTINSTTSQPSAYFGLFSVCGPLWLSPDGLTIYSACGSVYKASTDPSQDMRYLGTLPFTARTQSLAISGASNQIAAIPTVQSYSQPPVTITDSVVNLYAAGSFNPVGQFATTPFQVAGTPYIGHGRWVFYNSSSSKMFVVTEADSSAGLELDYAIESIDLTQPNSCGATFGSGSGAVGAPGGYATVSISSGEDCTFTAVSKAAWITLSSGYYGSGNSTLRYLARPNLSASPRSGSITLGLQTFTVSQEAMASRTELNPLSFKPIAALYDKPLNKAVMVSSAPNELHIYDPVTYLDQIVPLTYLPLSLAVSPNGLQVVVGHSGRISVVDLTSQKVTSVVPVDQDSNGIALASNGYAYVFPNQTLGLGEISSVQLATGSISRIEDVYHGDIPRLDATGSYIYVSGYNGGSKLDISQGPASVASYFMYTLGSNIWLSEDGTRVFGSTGNVYFTSPVPSQDLQPDGRLTSAVNIDWIADSQVNKEVAILMESPQSDQNSQIQIYQANGLELQSELAMPSFSSNGNSYASHGKYLFWNSAESELFAILQADSTAGLLSDYAVYTVSTPQSLPACTYSVTPNSVNVWASSASWILNVRSNCVWAPTITSGTFLTVLSSEMIGNGQVNLSVWSNTGGERSAVIQIGNQTVTINQASSTCTYQLATSSATFSQTGGSGTVGLVTEAGCPWSVESSVSWLSVTSSSSGVGPATIRFTVAPAQTFQLARSAALNVAGTLFRVTQETASSPGKLQLSPAELNISGSVGGTALSTVTITNIGGLPVTVDSVSTSGPFSVTDPFAASPFTVQPGGSVQMTVSFEPTAAGSSSGVLLVTSTTGPQQTITLSGTGFEIHAGGLSLHEGQSVSFGRANLTMQGDGNLVLYDQSRAIWSTGTWGQSCGANQCLAVFQRDGNLVVYNGSTPLWNSGTSGHTDAELILSAGSPQLEIVGSNQSILWTNVAEFSGGRLVLRQGASMSVGSMYLVMQGDGNLVLYGQNRAIWSTGTWGQNCGANQCFAVFQGDGNLVVYNGSTPLWSSGTWGNAAAQLVVSTDSPQLEIIGSSQSILWSDSAVLSAAR